MASNGLPQSANQSCAIGCQLMAAKAGLIWLCGHHMAAESWPQPGSPGGWPQ